LELDELEMLDLSGSQVSNEGIRELTKLRSLQGLNLYGTQVTEDCIADLESMPNLQWAGIPASESAKAAIEKRGERRLTIYVH
jgi:hypothetical protein